MAEFSYEEAVYGATCYIFLTDDGELSVEEQETINDLFFDMYNFSFEQKNLVLRRLKSKGSTIFFHNVVDCLNEYSKARKLEALASILVIIDKDDDKHYLPTNKRRPFNKIQEAIGISDDDLSNYFNN